MKIFVTGGCGFIGTNFIHYLLRTYKDAFICTVDKLTYAGNLENLETVLHKYPDRLSFVKGDITDSADISNLMGQEFDIVVNFAAESHVDRSIEDPATFLKTNILGTQALLEGVRRYGGLFVQISTDEVYGSLGPEGKFTETTPLAPNSPYSTSKASADLLAQSYAATYNVPVIITRCSNNYGPYQFPEKLIPLILCNALDGKSLPIYGDGQNIRDWLYVEDHCRAIDQIMRAGLTGRIFNIGGNCEKTNLDLVYSLLHALAKHLGHDPDYFDHLITFVTDRPGHDRRYAMDFSLLKSEIGWEPDLHFKTV